MKKLFVFSLALAAAMGNLIKAESVNVDGIFYEFNDTEKTATVVVDGNNSYTGDFVIPGTVSYNGGSYTVTAIGDGAFDGSSIASITFPSTIKTVAANAFSKCPQLKVINVPDIKSWCAIEFENEFANPIKIVRQLTIDGVVVSDVVIPDDVTSIGSYSFYNSRMASVTLGSGLEKIGPNAFNMCRLISTVTIPDNVTELGVGAFKACSNMGTVTIGSGIETISDEAFLGTKLNNVALPPTVKHIGARAFSSCNSLTDFTMGIGVETVGEDAFNACRKLANVNTTDLDAWCRIKFANGAANPCGYTYSLKFNGNPVENVVYPSGIGRVNDFVFESLSTLKTVTIPDDVIEIGKGAFHNCSSLTTVTMGDQVEKFDDMAFFFTSSLTSLDMPASLKEIGVQGFCMTGLVEVVLPEGLTTLREGAFQQCSQLKSIKLPRSLTTIERYAFNKCTKLESIAIPVNVATLSSYACSDCTSLRYVQIQNPDIVVQPAAFSFDTNIAEAWVNTPNVCTTEFPAKTILYVPQGCKANWASNEKYASSDIREAGVIETNATPDYTTYFINASYKMPEGLEGYTVKSVDKGVLGVEKSFATGATVPYATAVMVKSAGQSFNMFELSTDDQTLYAGTNLLKGVNSKTVVEKEADKAYYQLGDSKATNQFGFIPVGDGDRFMAGAHTAYLAINATEAPADGFYINEAGQFVGTFNDDDDSDGFVTISGIKYQINEDKKSVTVTADEYTGRIYIPETITVKGKTYTVNAIGHQAFRKSNITEVTIGNNVETIDLDAFNGCSKLKTINMGTGVKTVKNYAFGLCTALERINVTDLKSWCAIDFENDGANPLNMTQTIYVNGEDVTDLVVPADAVRIGSFAFYNNKFTSIDLGKGVTEIGASAFRNAKGLTKVVIPDNVKSIGANVFAGCEKLADLTIGNGIATVAEFAFDGCKALTAVVIPDNVITIDKSAFNMCTNLTDLTIGTGVENINDHAFASCRNLTTVNIKDLDKWCDITFTNAESNPTAKSKTLSLNGVNVTKVDFPAGIGRVKDFTFQNCKDITTVTLPNDITSIGHSAFHNNLSLTSVAHGNNIEKIEESAFNGCAALAKFDMPEFLKEVGLSAFAGCALTEVILPEGFEKIGQNSFQNNTALNNVFIPNTVTTVEAFAFSGCSALDSITFPYSVTALPIYVCSGCTGLKYLHIINPEATIGFDAFNLCDNLAEVWINNKTVSYKQFPKTAKFFVPYGSADTWASIYMESEIHETGFLNIDENLCTTYYVEAGYVVPDGVDGYTIAGVNANGGLDIVKSFPAGTAVPFATPVFFKAENPVQTVFVVDRDDENFFSGKNCLKGSDKVAAIEKQEGKSYYTLGYDEEGTFFGFVPVLENGAFMVDANTAYLVLDSDVASDNGYNTDGESGIETIADDRNTAVKGIYRLDGTKVATDNVEELQPGFYIIDGKKVIINR